MRLATRISLAVVAGTASSAALCSAAWAAPGGYGPSVPTGPADTPGGYANVVTTETVGPSGGSLTGAVAGGTLRISVPAGAFPSSAQVEVTSPDLSQITPAVLGGAGFTGYTSIAGFGVKVLDTSGTAMTGTFAEPITVTLRASGLSGSDEVLRLDGATTASVVPSTVNGDQISIRLDRDPNLVVVSPGSGAVTSIPGATTQPTGLPLRGELLGGACLVAAGAVALAATRRRSRA